MMISACTLSESNRTIWHVKDLALVILISSAIRAWASAHFIGLSTQDLPVWGPECRGSKLCAPGPTSGDVVGRCTGAMRGQDMAFVLVWFTRAKLLLQA
eukprot:308946-Pelagomonas_calceolata.AAC.6